MEKLVLFEVGKLSDCKRIYGIDNHEYSNYDWQIGIRNQEKINDPTYNLLFSQFEESKKIDTLPLVERMSKINTKEYGDLMINLNFDGLHYFNSEGTFDATDQAATYYHRNLRWFANMNKIELTKDDRVLMLSGASHSAFLQDLIARSPKFCLMDVQDYLK